MTRFWPMPGPAHARQPRDSARVRLMTGQSRQRLTFTGAIGAACMYPLRAIIDACVALRIHPNTLTLIGVIVNVAAAWALGFERFMLAGFIMIVANIFDFIDGKVAH